MENMAPFFLRGVLRHQGEVLPTLGMADYEQQAESSEFEQEDLRSSGGTVAIRSQLQARQIAGPH